MQCFKVSSDLEVLFCVFENHTASFFDLKTMTLLETLKFKEELTIKPKRINHSPSNSKQRLKPSLVLNDSVSEREEGDIVDDTPSNFGAASPK